MDGRPSASHITSIMRVWVGRPFYSDIINSVYLGALDECEEIWTDSKFESF